MSAIGIDLGTTNSLVAYYTEEGPRVIPNRIGKRLTPSVVSIGEDGQVYVGESAAEQMLLNPDVKNIFDFKYEDFELVNYDPWPHIAGKVSV